MNHQSPEDINRKNARTGLAVVIVVLAMLGLSFASVPLYNLFCRVTGFGGTTQVADTAPQTQLERIVRINLNSDTAPHMPWDFKPEIRSVEIHLGERALVAFMAHNKAKIPVTGTALYNVTPAKAGKYFNKIQCFCFDEQMLAPGEEMSMPVMFFVDPAMDQDQNMEDVQTITLSYTFFPADSKELEQALEAFYNGQDPASGDTSH